MLNICYHHSDHVTMLTLAFSLVTAVPEKNLTEPGFLWDSGPNSFAVVALTSPCGSTLLMFWMVGAALKLLIAELSNIVADAHCGTFYINCIHSVLL